MRCSVCSDPVRPVVAIDIDGTLGDWHLHFQVFAEQWLGHTLTEYVVYDGSEPFREWFTRAYGVDVTTFREIKLAFRQSGLKRTMPAHRDAKQAVARLRKHAEVWLTTTRPYNRYDRIDPDTVEWLRRNGIGHDGLLYDEDKIKALCERVNKDRVVAVLDDEVDVLLGVPPGPTPILYCTVYNRKNTWVGASVSTMAMAQNMINKLLVEWERKHG